MGQFAWTEPVGNLSATLDAFKTRVDDGDPGTTGLEELKSALDELRLRAWGLLTSANSEDPHGFQERFRTRRGIEMCRALRSDVQTGKLSGGQPDLPALGAEARDLAATVKQATRKPPKRSRRS